MTMYDWIYWIYSVLQREGITCAVIYVLLKLCCTN